MSDSEIFAPVGSIIYGGAKISLRFTPLVFALLVVRLRSVFALLLVRLSEVEV